VNRKWAGNRVERSTRFVARRWIVLAAVACSGVLLATMVTPAMAAKAAPAMAAKAAPAVKLVKPPVPTTGAYLGGWVNPNGQARNIQDELTQLPGFNKQLGRNLAIVHVYQEWTATTPISDLDQIASTGAAVLLSWYCGDADSTIVAGTDDHLIRTEAKQLKSFKYPVFLRWFWEPNFPSGPNTARCLGSGGPAGYIAAWQHIWNIFQTVGAKNVAFVWAMASSGKSDFTDYYPGNQYVDWVAADGYDKDPAGISASTEFSHQFTTFYNDFASSTTYPTYQKPIMIPETGAQYVNGSGGDDQTPYVQSILPYLQSTFTDIKALVYFDAGATPYNWTLQGTGLTAFDQMADSSYFSPQP
jgi:Glycosyl hydrolase family 26